MAGGAGGGGVSEQNDFLTFLGVAFLLFGVLWVVCEVVPAALRDIRRWWRNWRWEKDR